MRGSTRGRVQGQQRSLAVPRNSDLPGLARALIQPAHRGQHFRHFVADDVATHVIRLPIKPFPMRLVGPPRDGVAGPPVGAAHQRGYKHQETVFGKTARNWASRGTPSARPTNCSGVWSASGRATTQALAWPSGSNNKPSPRSPPPGRASAPDSRDRVWSRRQLPGCRRRRSVPCVRGPRIHDTEQLLQTQPVRKDGTFVGRRGAGIAFPKSVSFTDGFLDPPFAEAVQAVHQSLSEIILPCERRGPGQNRPVLCRQSEG